MTSYKKHEKNAAKIASSIAELCDEQAICLAVAESLTGGKISSQLAAAPGSGNWFAGGVVAYSSEVKHRLLMVPRGSVISAAPVEMMARSACSLMEADAAVAASGAGGPDGQDGQDPGTTWIAVLVGDDVRSELHRFQGDPIDILSLTEEQALAMLLAALQDRYVDVSE